MKPSAGDRPLHPTPGDSLLHPIALLSIATLLLNDHLLKPIFASWWTGKLSDIAGMIFFPLFLLSIYELIQRRERFVPTQRALLVCVVLTGLVFGGVQLFSPMTQLYRYGLGAIQWPFRVAATLFSGKGWSSLQPLQPVEVMADPSDLLTLPALLIAYRIGRRRISMFENVDGTVDRGQEDQIG